MHSIEMLLLYYRFSNVLFNYCYNHVIRYNAVLNFCQSIGQTSSTKDGKNRTGL